MQNESHIRLTQTVQKGGCAAKVAASELRKILAQVQFPPTPKELLIGSGTFDDAAIYKINAELALVQTLDFFTPIVDTPKLFGKIAAANALSDVYAMGGKPITAMAIFAFPLATLDNSVAIDVLQGASDIITQSGASFVGGHTIDDDTLKFGLSVTGFVSPQHIWSNAGAKVNDTLILTKALGTGTLTAALKRGEVTESEINDALESMCTLNNVSELLSEDLLSSIHAATDVTGFGLAGHALNMAHASHVCLNIETSKLPTFTQTIEFLNKGFLTKAHRTNSEYVKDRTQFLDSVDSTYKNLVFDPQTSGGLLLSVDSKKSDLILQQIKQKFPTSSVIGQVTELKNTAHLHFS